MSRFFSLVILTGLLLPLSGLGQEITPAEDLDYIIEEFTLPGGRLGNNVNDIVQGPYGFLWFGSHGGLHRYDGYEFVTYNNVPGDTIGETTSLSYQYAEDLFWDSSNILWVTTYGGGLFRFDPKTEIFTHFRHDPDDSTTISHPRVLCAVEDAQGNLWFGTEGGGLNRFDRENETFTRYYANPDDERSLSNNDVRTLYVDKAGTLWAGTGFIYIDPNSGALSRYDPDTDTFDNFIVSMDSAQSAVRGIFEDSQGNFWVGTAKGLYKMNRELETFEFMDYDPSQPFPAGVADRDFPAVYSIIEDHNGGLWIGTIWDYEYKSHLTRYDPKSGSSQVLPVTSAAWHLCESRDGTIWVAGAGDSGKALRIRSKTITYELLKGQSLYLDVLKSPMGQKWTPFGWIGPTDIAFDPMDGSLWLECAVTNINGSTDSSLILLINYDPETDKTEFYPLPDLNTKRTNSEANNFGAVGLLVDDDGIIWGSLPSENIGLYTYDPANDQIQQYLHVPGDSTTLSSNEVITIMKDSKGNIWAATFYQGLNRLDPGTGKIKQYHFNTDPWGDSGSPISLLEDKNGKIWISGDLLTRDGQPALAVLDQDTEKIEQIPIPSQYTWNILHTMAQSPTTGRIVFTFTGNGIGSYDPVGQSWHLFNTSNSSFPFDNAAGVVCDQNGLFWVSDYDSGTIVRIDESMNFFTFQDKLSLGSSWRAGVVGPENKVYFPSSWRGGWIEIDPESILPESELDPGEIKVVGLSILGEKQELNVHNTLKNPVWMSDNIILPNEAQSFGFRFSDFDFQNQGPRFEYRLLPFEKDWVRPGNSPVANYYKVPHGDYTFQVRSLRSGFTGDRMIEMKVTILPPWWLTWWAFTIYGIVFIAGVYGVHTIQKKRTIRKERERSKDKELEQAKEIEKAYNELKTTQKQLIHSEKMASLGELTAGIAHEIQNPLNFVNNFSDVNSELVEELKEEIDKGNTEEAKAIADDIGDNEKKIVHHGKRAEEIVKSMLQHSRGSEGKKEPTDINALADEYLRLAYHGMRAKDKSFNVTMDTELDPNLGEVEIVPQDIGRVILNLITNAFYAVNERKASNENGYQPAVTVKTRKENGRVEIDVKDNGSGIPEHVRDKIFQPFFSTKGTGKGTGLGLSLSYDIITKGHGGSLEVDSKEGEGTEFKIYLPVK